MISRSSRKLVLALAIRVEVMVGKTGGNIPPRKKRTSMANARAVPTEDQRAVAATIVRKVVGRSIDGTVLWEKWVREISQAMADAAWTDPYTSDESDMAEGRKP